MANTAEFKKSVLKLGVGAANLGIDVVNTATDALAGGRGFFQSKPLTPEEKAYEKLTEAAEREIQRTRDREHIQQQMEMKGYSSMAEMKKDNDEFFNALVAELDIQEKPKQLIVA